MSGATTWLQTLAWRAADGYLARVRPRAILLVGSAASGQADRFSDLDVVVYHQRVPPGSDIAQAAIGLGAERYWATPWSDGSGEPDQDGVGERYLLEGIECQVGHISVGAFERVIQRVVVELELSEELFKIISGLFEGLPIHGQGLIERWRQNAAYTPELQRAVIDKRWSFFPWWFFQQRLRVRDTTVWRYDVL